MTYVLQAVIAGEQVLRAAVRDLPAARLATLGQGLALMPLTDALCDAVASGRGRGARGFRWLPDGFDVAVAGWSAAGPVAYVEAEYFGGAGEQRAAAWDGGTLVLGPLHVEEGQPFPATGSPISQALRRLGVVASADGDEFSAVGLGRHRRSAAWIA
ncbi:hypothetical protein STRCI_008297 [Streptomyces cinnabarinus]|uniref:Uncharacterized protein n=1 Tax=Streptomyces cinnabarinus TaxID=67287 RepID=A0ABY7KQ32_9ACTN|nr:hypothetical protein [Streptomyces cinnabarinus]WAZ26685.1 hypothetical protein STRCI_008297 [Streptomyces cinnabarinus]